MIENIGEVHFSRRTIIRLSALLASLIGLGALFPPLFPAAIAVAALYSLRSTTSAIKSLAFIYLIRAINPAFTGSLNFTVTAILAVLVCCAKIYYDCYRYQAGFPRPLRYLTLYVAVTTVLSVIASPFLTISLFKLFYFYFVATAILMAFSLLSKSRTDMLSWVANFQASVAIVSLPLVFHGYGYFKDGQGFQGILNHPQEFAIFMAPFAAMLAVKTFSSTRGTRLVGAMLIFIVGLLLLTRARTSMLSLTLGVAGAYFAYGFRTKLSTTFVRFFAAASAAIILLGAYEAVAPGGAVQFVKAFVEKGEEGALSERFYASRGYVIEEGIDNFLAHPFTGVGFGVNVSELRPSQPVYEPLTGLPISFPTEKGNLVVAVLEEGGAFGFGFFALFLYQYFRSAKGGGRLQALAMGFTALFTNIGEMTFFSMNSYGLFLWLLIGLSTARYDKKQVLT